MTQLGAVSELLPGLRGFFIRRDKLFDNENIITVLRRSTLIAELSDSEIETLVGLFTTRHYKSGEFIVKQGDCTLGDALLILVNGKVEVSAIVENEPVSMLLKDSGDLARIISFVGSNMMEIDATLEVKEDCSVLLLERMRLESLLDTHHSIVYRVMRGLVRYTHSLARHKSAETKEMENYIYQLNGRF